MPNEESVVLTAYNDDSDRDKYRSDLGERFSLVQWTPEEDHRVWEL